jgi:hypothetical protein
VRSAARNCARSGSGPHCRGARLSRSLCDSPHSTARDGVSPASTWPGCLSMGKSTPSLQHMCQLSSDRLRNLLLNIELWRRLCEKNGEQRFSGTTRKRGRSVANNLRNRGGAKKGSFRIIRYQAQNAVEYWRHDPTDWLRTAGNATCDTYLYVAHGKRYLYRDSRLQRNVRGGCKRSVMPRTELTPKERLVLRWLSRRWPQCDDQHVKPHDGWALNVDRWR